MLEIGPHSVAHLVDLLGMPEALKVEVDRPITLPTGKPFYRRWRCRHIEDQRQRSCNMVWAVVSRNIASTFAAGWLGHLRFRGGNYVLRRHAPLPDDFDRYQITRSEGKAC